MTSCALSSTAPSRWSFHGWTVTNDAGLLAYRELDNALVLTSTAASGLHEARTGQNTQHGLLAFLCQSLYSRLVRPGS
jgi:hypothetical protein